MAEDIEVWAVRRLHAPVTPTLVGIIGALSDAGFGWFEATDHRLEFARSLSDDYWEEVVVWTVVTRTGRRGFQSAHHAIRHIDHRTGFIADVLGWAAVPPEDVPT